MDLGFRMHAERTPNPNSIKWVLGPSRGRGRRRARHFEVAPSPDVSPLAARLFEVEAWSARSSRRTSSPSPSARGRVDRHRPVDRRRDQGLPGRGRLRARPGYGAGPLRNRVKSWPGSSESWRRRSGLPSRWTAGTSYSRASATDRGAVHARVVQWMSELHGDAEARDRDPSPRGDSGDPGSRGSVAAARAATPDGCAINTRKASP
jgi:hypothetical protein